VTPPQQLVYSPPPQVIGTFPTPLDERAAVVKGGHKDRSRLVWGGRQCLLVPGETPGWWQYVEERGERLFLP